MLAHMSGPCWLAGALLYGAGLRLSECLELRVKDLDIAGGQIVVRSGKGGKDRRTMLPVVSAAIRNGASRPGITCTSRSFSGP